MRASIDQLTAALAALTGRGGDEEALAALGDWKAAAWRDALIDLPLGERAFRERFLVRRRDEIDRLWHWWQERERDPRVDPATAGHLGFLLLTLVAMHCSDRMRFHNEPAAPLPLGDTTAERLCTALVDDAHVRHAIADLYNPRLALSPARHADRAKPSPEALREWKEIDPATLRFHRQGTTSIILTGRDAEPVNGRTARFALKCLIYPYLKVPTITDATRGYLTEYGQLASDSSPLVRVWASHDSWILMDFVPGRTLAELLRDRPAREPKREILRPLDVDRLELLGTALFRALAELEDEGRHHDDLAPSNIIAEETGGAIRMRLIDLGVNHLHTGALGGALQGDALYVAPEVRVEGSGDERAELYSLGLVLITVAGIDLNPDGTVPDQFYVASTGLARLLEDLVDVDPERRLLVSGVEPGRNRFRQLHTLFANEIEVLREIERTAPTGWIAKLRSFSPGIGTVSRQRRIRKVRQDQAGREGGSPHLARAKRLMAWAVLCSVLLWCATAIIMTWWARDLNISWTAKWLELLNNVFNRSGPGIVFFDDVRAADYAIPDLWGSFPSRIVTATFALVSLRMYLNIFAELTPASALPRRGMRRFRSAACAVAIRSQAILFPLYALFPTLVQRDWWPLFTQVGIFTMAVIISVCLWFAGDAYRSARGAGLSTVPSAATVSRGRLVAWQPILLLYCVPILVIGTLLQFDLLEDELVYACFVSLINIAIFYFKSAGTDAPYVRMELSRAFLAAERLDHLEARERAAASPASEGAAHADAGPAVDAVGGLAVADRA
jgi:hypothetical protein